MNIGLLIAALAIGVIAEDNRRRPRHNPNLGSISCHSTRTHRDCSDSDDDRHHRRSSHCVPTSSCMPTHHIRPTKCSEVVWCKTWWDEHDRCNRSTTCSTSIDCECDHWKKCNYKPGCHEWNNYWAHCFNATCTTSASVLPTSAVTTTSASVLPTSAAVTSSSANVLPTQAVLAASSCPPCTTVTVKMQMPLVCNTVVICNPLYNNCPAPSGTRTLTLGNSSASSA